MTFVSLCVLCHWRRLITNIRDGRLLDFGQGMLHAMVRVHADASRKQQTLEALKLFDKYDIPKSGSTYSTMIRVMAATRALDDALKWKEAMLDAGFVPGPSTFGALIRSAAREQDADTLVDLLDEREQRGVSLPQVNFFLCWCSVSFSYTL